MPSTSSSEITLVVRLLAKDGCAEDLRRSLQATVGPTRQEEGCLHYRLHRSASTPNRFLVYEGWASEEAIEHHEQTEHMQALNEAFDRLLEEHDIERYEQMSWEAPPQKEE